MPFCPLSTPQPPASPGGHGVGRARGSASGPHAEGQVCVTRWDRVGGAVQEESPGGGDETQGVATIPRRMAAQRLWPVRQGHSRGSGLRRGSHVSVAWLVLGEWDSLGWQCHTREPGNYTATAGATGSSGTSLRTETHTRGGPGPGRGPQGSDARSGRAGQAWAGGRARTEPSPAPPQVTGMRQVLQEGSG